MDSITFEKALNEYFIFIKLKLKNTTFITNKRKMKLYILNYFKNKNIYDFNIKDYLEWQIFINNFDFSYNYKSSLHYCFTNFLDFCILMYKIDKNIAKIVGNFKNNEINNCGNIWTYDDFKKFINEVDNNIYHALFNFLFFTGCRKGEALALTWNDINLENNTVFISKTITRYLDKNGNKIIQSPKTKKSIRNICIDNQLKNELLKLKQYYTTKYDDFQNNFYVFGGKKSISFTTLKRNKDYYCNKAQVTKIKIHEFRHSHACLLFTNDVPINDISNRLGHSSISMTMDIYLKYLPKNEKRVINTLTQLRLN